MMKIKRKSTTYKINFDKPKPKPSPNQYQSFYRKIEDITGVKKVKYDNFDPNKIHIKINDYNNFDEIIYEVEKLWELKW